MRAEHFRQELVTMVRRSPFQKFLIGFESGGYIVVEQPTNVAFHPTPGDGTGLHILGGGIRHGLTLDDVSFICSLDQLVANIDNGDVRQPAPTS